MASAMTDWGTGQFLGICLGLFTAPGTMYAALCSDEPGEQIDGTTLADLEPVASGYARVAVSMGASNWTSTDGVPFSTNINTVDFGVPTDDWGSISHFALCSASTAGEVYLYGEFDVPPEVNPSYRFTIDPGGLVIAFGSFQPAIVAV